MPFGRIFDPAREAARRLAKNPFLMNRATPAMVQPPRTPAPQVAPPLQIPQAAPTMAGQPSAVGAATSALGSGITSDMMSKAIAPTMLKESFGTDPQAVEKQKQEDAARRQEQGAGYDPNKDVNNTGYQPEPTPSDGNQNPAPPPDNGGGFNPLAGMGSQEAQDQRAKDAAAAQPPPEKDKSGQYQDTLESIVADLLGGKQSGYEAQQAQSEAAKAYNDQMSGIENLGVDTPWAMSAEAQARAMKGGLLAKSAEQQRAARMQELMSASGIEQGLYQTEQGKTPDYYEQYSKEAQSVFGPDTILTAGGKVISASGEEITEDIMNPDQRRWLEKAKQKMGITSDEDKSPGEKNIDVQTRKDTIKSLMGEFDQGYAGGGDEDLPVISGWVDNFAKTNKRWPTRGEMISYLKSIGEEDLPDVGDAGAPAFTQEAYDNLYG